MGNSSLSKAKASKNDEFYTLIEDVEKEMGYYHNHFYNKTIFLNCDDPDTSAFWLYFTQLFDFLGLKKLVATHYEYDETIQSYKLVYERDPFSNKPKVTKTMLKGNGDFRSEECVEILKASDIVITNPPFSLWGEYVEQLIEYKKKFLILGNLNALTRQDIFPYVRGDKMWFGISRTGSGKMYFRVPDDAPEKSGQKVVDGVRYQTVGSTAWYTNLEHSKRNEELVLTKFYEGNEEQYPTYDNYNAIETGFVKDIPMDYEGLMGVPITFLASYNPEQFEILGMTKTPICFTNAKEAQRTKVYKEVTQHSRNGKTSSGNKVNDGSVLIVDTPPKKTYYTTEDVDGYLTAQYPRMIIRNKKPISRAEVLGF